MSIGFWQLGILILLFFPSLIALILCLLLIKKKNYKKLPKNKIYAGFWHRFLAYLIDYINTSTSLKVNSRIDRVRYKISNAFRF